MKSRVYYIIVILIIFIFSCLSFQNKEQDMYGNELEDIGFLVNTWINMNGVFRGNLKINEDKTYSWKDPDSFWEKRPAGKIKVTDKYIIFEPDKQEPVVYSYEFDAEGIMKLTMNNVDPEETITYFFSD